MLELGFHLHWPLTPGIRMRTGKKKKHWAHESTNYGPRDTYLLNNLTKLCHKAEGTITSPWISVNGKEHGGNVSVTWRNEQQPRQSWSDLCSFQSSQVGTGISRVWPVRQVTATYLAQCKHLLHRATPQLMYLLPKKKSWFAVWFLSGRYWTGSWV